MEEEIDLRRYIRALVRQWRLVIGLPIVATVAALVVSSVLPRTYEAQVYVAATKLKMEVQFGTQIETLTEEELAAAGGQASVDRKARLATFRALVINPEIAQTVLPQFEDRLRVIDERLLDPARLLQHVSSEEDKDSDLIAIVVSLSDPQLAADIANAWGQAYEQLVNQLYSGVRSQDVTAVQAQTAEAYQTYIDAQTEFETYLADNPMPRLSRQINVLQTQIRGYQDAITETESLVSSRELSTRRQLLSGYYGDLVVLQRLLDDAHALEQQLALGESSPAGAFGDALAVIFTRSRAFAGASNESGAPFSLQLQTPLEAGNVNATDVQNLIQVLEARQAETETKIEELTGTLLDPPQYSLHEGAGAEIKTHIEELTAEMQTLQARLEAEAAHRQDLERQRDLAWGTYSTLARKEAEVQVAVQSGGTEVRVASLAVPPARPTSPRKMVNTAIAGALGLIVSVFGVFAVEWWRGEGEGQGGKRQEDRVESDTGTGGG